ncbi:MAG TPA: hypothetical protein DCP97_00510 [Ruminococcaceae bacterium]|nr:hypothetical protein [Oscillospiraceae bacterium]
MSLSSSFLSWLANDLKIEKEIRRLQIQPSGLITYMSKNNVKVACIQLKMRPYYTIASFINDMNSYIKEAVSSGAHIVCLPEYTGMLIYPIISAFNKLILKKRSTAEQNIEKLRRILFANGSQMFDIFSCIFINFAIEYGIYIMPGSAVFCDGKKLYNRSVLIDYIGEIVCVQDKLALSEIETELGFAAGDTLETAATKFGKCSILIGDDERYFEFFKIAKESGADIVFVPSCTTKFIASDNAQFRANDSGLYVAKAAMLGKVWDITIKGVSGIYSPCGIINKQTAVLSRAQSSNSEVVIAAVNMEKLNDCYDVYRFDTNESFNKNQFGMLYQAGSYKKAKAIEDD